MFNLNEPASLELRMETSQANKELEELDQKVKELNKNIKEVEQNSGKGSEEWKKYKNELKETEAALKQMKKEVDLSSLTYGQLQNVVKDLNKDLKTLKPGTDDFNAAVKRLSEAEKQLSAVKTQVNDIKKGGEEIGKPTMWEKVSGGVGLVAKAFTALMALQIIQYLVQGFTAIIGKFTEFEDAAQELSAITGMTGKDLEYLKDQAKATGPQFGMTAAEMLKAYQLMGSAKPELLANKEALAETTKEAIILAKAGKMDLAEAAKVTAESLNQWGAKSDQARRFINVMAAGAKEGAAEINEMSGSLKASGTVAASAKLSFEQTNAVLQSLSTIALKGEQSGTMLRNVLIKLQSGAAETNPAMVGLDKALENLGKQNLSTAELAKKFGTENIVAAQHIITHREEISELTKKMSGTNTAYEQAATNMDTLSERWNRSTAIVTGFAVSIGEKLAPYVKSAIDLFISWSENLDVNAGVVNTLWGALGELWDVFKTLITLAFPGLSSGGTTMRGVMQGVAVVLQTVVSVVRLFTTSLVVLLEAFQAVGSGAKGLVAFLAGDFSAAGKYFDETRQHGVKIKDTFSKTFSDIGDGYKKAFADKPKEVMPAAVAANTATQAAIENAVTGEAKKGSDKRSAEQKKADAKAAADKQKHLDEVKKANEKALGELAKLEDENHIARIKTEEGRDIAKLQAARDREAEAIMKGLQAQSVKDKQLTALNQKLEQDIADVHTKYADKKKKEDEEAAQKRLEVLRNVAKQEQEAEMALLDWKELQARGNSQKLAQIAKDRSNTILLFTINGLKEEEAAEKARATREISDKDLLAQTLSGIEKKYLNERKAAVAANAADIAKIEADLQQKKKELWSNAGSAFGALLKGDLSAFADYSAKLFQGQQQGWQKTLEGNMQTYQAIGQMAQQAAQFLADLAQKRAEKAIAAAMQERDRKVAVLQEELDTSVIEVEHYEQRRQELAQHYSDQVRAVKEAEKQKLSELEAFYAEKAGQQSAADMSTELARTTQQTDALIAEAERTFQGESDKASQTRDHKVNVANAVRDAEIAAINARADLALADKERMIAAATAKADEAIRLANQEADGLIAASRQATDQKIANATEEAAKKTQLMDQLSQKDGETVQQMAARADQEAAHQAQLAQQTYEVETAKAEATRDQKIAAANAIRDAEVSAINARADLSMADKAAMIAASTAKAAQEIALATDQATQEIALSDQKKTQAIADAEAEKNQKHDFLKEYAATNDETTRNAIDNARKQADESIAEAQRTKEEEISAAEEERDKKIEAANKTRDEEISAIRKRSDISMQERNRLIDAAKEKAELEIRLANEEAESKIKLSKEETEQKIKDATEEKEKKIDLLKQLATADKDRAQELLKLAKDEADQKIKTAEAEKKKKLQMLADENKQRIQQKYDLEEQIADANEEARQTEIEQKRKAWQSQKKADVASALISGALATIKALASGIFPLNLVFAAVTAAMTAVQIAKIKSQPEPQFRYGGLMKGSSHGVTYGTGGLAIIDRATNQERGEMEGDEAIISKEQTRANWPLISRMLENARTPGRRHTPVDRPPVALRNGGLLEPKRYGEMYLFGSKKKKEAEAAAREAEAEAARASAEAEASAAEAASAASGFDTSGGGDVSGSMANEAEAKAAQEEAQKQGRMQLQLLQDIVDSIGALDQNQQAAMNNLANRLSGSVDAMGQQVAGLNGAIMEVKGAVNGVEGATHQVKDAVYATNAQGKIDQLISAISSLG